MRHLVLAILLINLSVPTIIKAQSEVVSDTSNLAIRPTQAAFYSAVFPGMGQIYNKDYWHVPVVYAALGGSVYLWVYNRDKFEFYRSLYKQKKIDPEATEYTFDWLERAQKYYKKKKDLAIMLTAGTYALQIVWAGVEAHLDYFDTNHDLTFSPVLISDYGVGNVFLPPAAGLRISYKF